ncbi:hypothetical protein [uncultured Legionella sp.]|uniref:hypothetical protein n=1 Tax=uncultured Legionella sp. TaxID=210934 RepID=UPI00261D7B60|nr:hypothetical protein [uncultured Legionella sp.]
MSLYDLCICEFCGTTFKSRSNEDVCSSCSQGTRASLPNHQKCLRVAKKNRQHAKAVGLKTLTGTSKQKAWGEVIRMQFLAHMERSITVAEEDVHAVYHLLTSVLFKPAAVWIKHRDDLEGLQMNLVKAVQLKSKANAMHAKGESKTEEYRLIADQYHEIIERF